MNKKAITLSIIAVFIGIMLIALTYLYQSGQIGKDSISRFLSHTTNPYNGIYYYDKSKIKDPDVLNALTYTEEQPGRDQGSLLRFHIDNNRGSLLGQQFHLNAPVRLNVPPGHEHTLKDSYEGQSTAYLQRVSKRGRFANICLEPNGMTLNFNYSWNIDDTYCKNAPAEYSLHLRSVDDETLYCENCTEYDLPPYWIKMQIDD